MRTIGQGNRGRSVVYKYGAEKKFLGFLSYELDDATYAFGAFDSICNHLNEGELPQIETSNSESRKKRAPVWDENREVDNDPLAKDFQETIVA